jgi:hypothetical protein
MEAPPEIDVRRDLTTSKYNARARIAETDACRNRRLPQRRPDGGKPHRGKATTCSRIGPWTWGTSSLRTAEALNETQDAELASGRRDELSTAVRLDDLDRVGIVLAVWGEDDTDRDLGATAALSNELDDGEVGNRVDWGMCESGTFSLHGT